MAAVKTKNKGSMRRAVEVLILMLLPPSPATRNAINRCPIGGGSIIPDVRTGGNAAGVAASGCNPDISRSITLDQALTSAITSAERWQILPR
jgi:hypothetical protein